MKLTKIHEDNRGTISILEEDLQGLSEVTIFHTNAGYARGGCIHYLSQEYNTVIIGDIIYYIGDEKLSMKTGESCIIPKSTSHYFISLTDSIVVEWGATPEEKIEKHIKTRKIVEEINNRNG